MRQMVLLAVSVVLAAAGIAYGLLTLAAEVRDVAGELAALSRNVNGIAGDVTSLADDVSAIADALSSEDGGDEEEGHARVSVRSPVTAPGAPAATSRSTVRGTARWRGLRVVGHDGRRARARLRGERPRETLAAPRHAPAVRQLTCSAATCRSW